MRWIAALLVVLISSSADAHKWRRADGTWIDASWILRDYPNCCGPKDCEPIDGRLVRRTAEGWRVIGLGGSVKRTHLSQDGKTWACRNLSNNTIRCLFLPGGS